MQMKAISVACYYEHVFNHKWIAEDSQSQRFRIFIFEQYPIKRLRVRWVQELMLGGGFLNLKRYKPAKFGVCVILLVL